LGDRTDHISEQEAMRGATSTDRKQRQYPVDPSACRMRRSSGGAGDRARRSL